MAKVFEVWHTNSNMTRNERYGEFESLDTAWQAISDNWSDVDGEEFSIVERMSDFNIVNEGDEVDPCYGLEKFTINVKDMNALLNGKKLYAQINCGEYAIEIDYSGNNE